MATAMAMVTVMVMVIAMVTVMVQSSGKPARSSRGSGSVKPLAFASATTCEKVFPAPKVLKIKDRVPLRMPSICISSSPVSSRLLRVDMTGKPAPTVACKHTMH